jgi:deazaflavin-dependent oxidoreductase (nitroreductase family)
MRTCAVAATTGKLNKIMHLALTSNDPSPAVPLMEGATQAPSPTKMRRLRFFTARFINPLTRMVAGRLPGFALITHTGRRSGRAYHTPINVFRRDDYYYFPLSYGSDVDWLKNVLAAGQCSIRIRGRTVRLDEPELLIDPDLRALPFVPRLIERWNGVTEVLRMRAAVRRPEGIPMPTLRAMDEADIRRRIDNGVKAIRAMDLDGVMALYAPDMVSFDIVPPLRHVGAEAKRKNWEDVFATYERPLGYEMHDLTITVGDDVAFGHSLNQISGTLRNGHRSVTWLRWTACFRKIGDTWLIAHDQVSVPVDFASGRALRDLQP